jgi:hypothetical protein
LFLKCSWRNGKSMARNFLEAWGAEFLGSSRLNSSPRWEWRVKGDMFPHRPWGVHQSCGKTPCGISFGDDDKSMVTIFPFKILQIWHGTVVGLEGRWSTGREKKGSLGMKESNEYQTNHKKTKRLDSSEKFQHFQNKWARETSLKVPPLIWGSEEEISFVLCFLKAGISSAACFCK